MIHRPSQGDQSIFGGNVQIRLVVGGRVFCWKQAVLDAAEFWDHKKGEFGGEFAKRACLWANIMCNNCTL